MHPESKNIRLLITGIRGFVGSNLLEYLRKHGGYHVTGTSRNADDLRHLESEDLTILSNDEVYTRWDSYDAYIHLAGKVHDVHDKNNDAAYFRANYDATRALYRRFKEDKRARKFIFLSTIHVLTETPEMELDEHYVPQPFTPYGKSKYKAETYIKSNASPDKLYYILRPSMIHGPGNKGNLNLLYQLVKSGIPYPVKAFNNKRSFVSIENLCFIIRELIEGEVEQGLYHVADDEPTYTHDLVKLIADATDKKGRIWYVPPLLLNLTARVGNILPLPLNEHRLKKLTGDFTVSNRKLKEALGKELPVRAREGLIRTLDNL
ncbi:MAG TPA: NAD-dependent epimerase/dehydratase family protein [Balneolaceae bacterium]|nr:NAD-dependent epimerase/dehydratase family protein [Balneolaceae bacterium]